MIKEHILYRAGEEIELNGNNVCLRFITSAQSFVINYIVNDVKIGNFPHVGITAREGLALLYRDYNEDIDIRFTNTWMPLELLARDYHVAINMSHMVKEEEIYEVLVYGPILAHLEKLSVEIGENDYFRVNPLQINLKKILFLGGSKTFGIGVTSAAMMFSNIIRRDDRIHVDRISYNQKNYLSSISDRLDKAVDLSVYDMIILELDGIGQDQENIERYLEKMIIHISKYSTALIWHSLPYTAMEKKRMVTRTAENGIRLNPNCIYLNLDFIFSDEFRDMCTYSVNFINDAGNVLIYQALNREIERCLWNT